MPLAAATAATGRSGHATVDLPLSQLMGRSSGFASERECSSQAKGEATAPVPHAHVGRRRAVIRGDVSSTGHGVPMAMRDPPPALLATVNLRGAQGVRARL